MTEDKLKRIFGEDGKEKSPELPSYLKNLIIDIDGVICEDVPNEEPERMGNAELNPKSKEVINNWHDEGHRITFFTARTEEHRKITENWLKDHGFKYSEVIFNKPRGGNYHYIDDKKIKATRFEGKLGEFIEKEKKIQVFD